MQTAIANKKQLVMDVLKGRSVPSELSRRVSNFYNYVSSEPCGGWGLRGDSRKHRGPCRVVAVAGGVRRKGPGAG